VILSLTAAVPLLIWLYLLLARGGFWRVRGQLDTTALIPAGSAPHPSPAPAVPNGPPAPRVVVLIPARDEAETIGTTVQSLLRQHYAGSIHIIVIDDESSDGTAQVARAAAAAVQGATRRLEVMRATSPPPGWTGKLWALSQGVQAALAIDPDYLLFTDADIAHGPGHLDCLVRRAATEQRDLVSAMVLLSVDSFAERCLIPAFVFFFFKLYPPRWIASSTARTAGAAGGCMLIRPQALERIGGVAAVRSQLIDDCSLAGAIKGTGARIWLGLTRQARSLRRYGSFAQIGSMISRSAFNQLHHSYLLLAATLLGLACTYLWAPLLLLSGHAVPAALGAAAWALMSLAYLPIVRFYGLPALWCVTLPAIALFYAGATLHSAFQYRMGRGGVWKGRVQDVRA
jgi:hopene-associated glycosyltransferase HpnB